jgi:hypothetical protein
VVRDPAAVAVGDALRVRVAGGELAARVTSQGADATEGEGRA